MTEELILTSIDWDYCIPVAYTNEFTTIENDFFSDNIWNARIFVTLFINNKHTLVKLTDLQAYHDFNFQKINYLSIGDSHASCYLFFDTLVKLYNPKKITIHHFDLHHDLWMLSESIDASSWLAYFIINNIKHHELKIIWHLPTWFKEQGHTIEHYDFINSTDKIYKTIKNHSHKLSILTKSSKPSFNNQSHVYLSRSPAWCPPHLDNEFIKLVQQLNDTCLETSTSPFPRSKLEKATIQTINNTTLDPITPREYVQPSDDIYNQLYAQLKQQQLAAQQSKDVQ